MQYLIWIWVALCACMMMIGIQGRKLTAGMPLAYFLQLSLTHLPGALLFVDSEDWDPTGIPTRLGFEQAIIGLSTFLFAVMIARAGRNAGRTSDTAGPKELANLNRLALIYLSGGAAYFILSSAIRIPSVDALIQSLSLLLVVGASLRLWVAMQSRNQLKFGFTLALLPTLPLVTMVNGGFIGYGTYWLLAIISFVYAQIKRRFVLIVLAPLLLSFGLSVFVTYMVSRTEFRKMMWYEHAETSEVIARIFTNFSNFEWVDFSNLKHREAIDGRLNQNYLDGMAVQRLESGTVDYAYGSTLGTMLLGLIPRAIWPEKPEVGGGGSIVTQFTGVAFAAGTSVGTGQVLEFYVNYGTAGVIGGFLIYGWLFGTIDMLIMESLIRGNQKRFLLWFMVCLSLLQPGGNLLEILVSVASSIVSANAIAYILKLKSSHSLPDNSANEFTTRHNFRWLPPVRGHR